MTREMRSLCFFKHCRLNYNREKTSYFAAKREAFNSWLEIVPGLTQHSKLCARHFDETDLKKGVVIGGDFYPFKAWRLRNGAVPKCHLVPESTSSSKAPPSSKVQRKNGAKVADKSANPDVSSDNARVQHEHTLELQQENEVECISNQENISEETIPSTNTNPPSAVDGSSSTFADAINTPMPISVPPPPPITPICGLDHTYFMMSAPANVANLAHDTSETINYDVTMDETPEPPDSTREARREDSQSAVVIPETSSNALENGDVIMEDPTVPLSSGSNTENLPTALDKKQCNAQVKLVSVGLTQQFLDELPKNVPLPDKDWFWVLNKARKQASCSVHIPLNDQMFIKTVIITSPTTLTFLANGKPLKLPNLQTTFKDHLSLYKAINRFSSAVLCQGLRDPSLKKIEPSNGSSATKNKDGTIRSNNCTIVSIPGNVCRKCKEVSAYLLKNVQRLLVKSARTKDEEKYLKRKISRYSTRLEKRKQLISSLKKELSEAKAESQKQSITHLMQQLNPMEKTILRLLITRSSLQCGDPKGARYGDSVMNQCSLFWLKNPPTYKFLRKNKIIPLPSESTIANYIKMNKDRLENIDSDFVRNLIGLKSKEARDGQEEEPPDVSESVEAETSADIREATNAGTSQVPLYTDIEIILT